ncbi:MAG: UDP-N-acetylmuramoyl-tripeptide--D-alanyl-D-alanine ligase [Flavobacterium sp.]|uniref:UDP-N-acetylmuramoyl-tripeptide--D-alanyl-D- alanine ligase n=1 Tax=Flavobacterium sp. TaxID=239 RepID=UPI001217C0C0|nr:UDP-N-acetylmuramoyl-tripeptide--D-alanyl-D-alanine ligase [Flavobacterium sp.]RZJ65545.1 MAG: UDP-N-acetylmuramoyl-tripeptide--D-alanyl-D-alanine ligase [Flavobacterium sp.]
MDTAYIHGLFLKCSSISIDTRKITENSMFVAIKGDRFDANTFAAEALQKGASYVLIDNADFYIDDRTIVVEDSLVALQQLSAFHRRYLGLPIIALTGSNGKTTTKELINVVLSAKFKTVATIGNLNNHIGVPLTLLSFSKSTEIGIVEMGANHQKEIEFLCEIAQPDFGYITNFGKAHLEGFGGVEGVIKGKSELYAYLQSAGKMAFVNLDDAIQSGKTEQLQRYTFAVANPADVIIDSVVANPFVQTAFLDVEISSHLIGLYNANNINAATCIGTYFRISPSEIKSAIEGYVPENNRSQMLQKGGNQIILDAYNANPSSMSAATVNFLQLDKPNKVMILGDMFELGDESLAEHKNLIATLENESDTQTHFIGKDFFSNKVDNPNLSFHEDFDAFLNSGELEKLNGKTLLIKGSRGMALERILDHL